MGVKIDSVDKLIWKLSNSLKGEAMMTRDANDMMMSQEEKLEHLEVIGEFLDYVRSYRENKRIIEEYRDMQERLMDDGR